MKKKEKKRRRKRGKEKGGNEKKGVRWDLKPGLIEYRALVRRGDQWSVLVSSWLVPTTTNQRGQNSESFTYTHII